VEGESCFVPCVLRHRFARVESKLRFFLLRGRPGTLSSPSDVDDSSREL